MATRSAFRWQYLLVALWLIFTISLTVWWMIFGLRQISAVRALDPTESSELARQQSMLLWEGGTLVLSLAIGAISLAVLSYRSSRQARAIQEFLAVFTHELKTPLTSLQLQAEALSDEPNINPILAKRLLTDTSRLTVRLDNALLLATQGSEKFFFESIRLSEVIAILAAGWPTLAIHLEQDITVVADRRALETILSNLLQNSVRHGKATEITIATFHNEKERIITVADNGAGYSGDASELGKLFSRRYTGSGSAIGLHTVLRLMREHGGSVSFPQTPNRQGFQVTLIFPQRAT